MNAILRKITNEMYNADTDYFYKRIGNYSVVRARFFADIILIKHRYFNNKICQVNVDEKTFELYHCGYENCRLITAQLIYLQKFYQDKGYKLLYRGI